MDAIFGPGGIASILLLTIAIFSGVKKLLLLRWLIHLNWLLSITLGKWLFDLVNSPRF